MVWAAAFSPDGKSLASAAGLYDKPGELILWDAATGRLQAKADEPKGIRALAFSPDGERLASADYYSNKVTLRDPATLKAVQTLQTPFANNAIAFSPDGSTSFGADRRSGCERVRPRTGRHFFLHPVERFWGLGERGRFQAPDDCQCEDQREAPAWFCCRADHAGPASPR